METTVILRTILYQAMNAESLDEVIDAVKVMCSKDDIAAVKEQIAESKKRNNKPPKGEKI
jgi:hypothetical protein